MELVLSNQPYKIRALGLDLDGTTLTSEHKLTYTNALAMKIASYLISIFACSGRAKASSEWVFEAVAEAHPELIFQRPYPVAFNGAEVYKAVKTLDRKVHFERIYERPLLGEVAEGITKFVQDNLLDSAVVWYNGDIPYARETTANTARLQPYIRKNSALEFRDISQLKESQVAHKLIVLAENKDKLRLLLDFVAATYAGLVYTAFTGSKDEPNIQFEVMDWRVNKKAAIDEIIKHENSLPPEERLIIPAPARVLELLKKASSQDLRFLEDVRREVITSSEPLNWAHFAYAGDSGNDKEALEAAAVKYAPANVTGEIGSLENIIITERNNNQNAVAEIIVDILRKLMPGMIDQLGLLERMLGVSSRTT